MTLVSPKHELADRPELLPQPLQAAGYRCGYSGKWHLGTAAMQAYGGVRVISGDGVDIV